MHLCGTPLKIDFFTKDPVNERIRTGQKIPENLGLQFWKTKKLEKFDEKNITWLFFSKKTNVLYKSSSQPREATQMSIQMRRKCVGNA